MVPDIGIALAAPARVTDLARRPDVAAAVLASVADGLYVVDREGRLVLMNPAAEALLGWTEAELRGRDMHEAVHFQDADGRPQDHRSCPLLAVLRTGVATRVRADAFTRKDGRAIDVAYTSSAVVEDGQVTGAVVLFSDVSEQRAVEQRAAELARERDEAADELQRNLLPALADVPGTEVAVSFRPVGASAVVGGDFYDVVPTAEGHLLVLGDVCGKGPAAAALAATVRSMLRGAAWHESGAAGLLRRLNAELLVHPSHRFCTMALAHLVRSEDGGVRASVSAGGHPRPVLVRADGRAQEVGAAGPLVGVLRDYEIGAEAVELAPGDALVLFSDGLTDVGRLVGRPQVDVRAVLDGTVPRSAAELVSRLERAAGVLDVEDRPDDVAILVVQLAPVAAAASAPPATPAGPAPADPAEIGVVESEFRDDNERLVAGRPPTGAPVAITCECGHPECSALLEVPAEAYERVRGDERAFLVAPGHEIPRAETVLERHPAWCVVRKHGEAGEVAAREA